MEQVDSYVHIKVIQLMAYGIVNVIPICTGAYTDYNISHVIAIATIYVA